MNTKPLEANPHEARPLETKTQSIVSAWRQKISAKLDIKLLSNMGWLGGAEVAARLSRLLTTIVLARYLMPYQYGVIAIAITLFDLAFVVTKHGMGQKIIQASEEALAGVCNAVYRLNWLLAGCLFIVQALLAWPIAWYYQDPELMPMMLCLGLIFLINPMAYVQVHLLQRKNQLQYTALALGAGMVLENTACAILAWQGFGVWSVIIPKLLVAPCWVIYHRYLIKWQANNSPAPYKAVFNFSRSVLGSELNKTVRASLDKLLIGQFLGLEALGLYYFAVNAGLGMSQSLLSAFNQAVFPHLCLHRHQLRRAFKQSLIITTAIAGSMLLIQAVLAPWYVPLLFGEQWLAAIPILILLVLSALPRPAAETAGQLLRAKNSPETELKWQFGFSLLLITALVIGIQWQLIGIAWAIFLSHIIALPLFVFYCYQHVCSAEKQEENISLSIGSNSEMVSTKGVTV